MGGKSSTTTQGVTIPPEVLARYNAVNARAETAAATPFKEYSQDPNAFVAPLTQTQLAGISGTNAAANQAQPYYQAATGQLIGAQQVGQYNTGQAYNDLNYAQGVGQYGTQQAYEPLNTGYYQGQAGVGASYGTINNSMYDAQNINNAALGGLGNAAMLGYAGNNAAGNSIYNAQQAGNAMTDASGNSILNAQMAGNNMTNTAANTIYGAQNMALGTGADAFNTQYQGMLEGKGNTASANNTLFNAYAGVQPLQQQAINNMAQSYYGAQGYNQRADLQYQQSLNQADPLNQAAIMQYAQGLGAASPVNYQALSQIGQSLEGAQPFQQQAQGLVQAGMQGVSPGQIGGQQIGQFMSPYISSVLQGTQGMLNQQNQQAMSGQTGNAIRQGAFGGDRAGIAAASLAQQQKLADAQIYSGILNQGYGQALGAAQQQQGVNLSAEQANRAAIQQGAQATLGIGQQGFGQGMTAAQQQAAMAQQLYSQQAGAGQNLAQIGQQIYGQQAGAGQNLAGLGQQQYGQGMGLSQAQLGAGQQQYAQGAQTAQQEAANAKQMYDMTAATAAHQQELAKLQFNIGSTTAAQQAALGQQTFGMGATTAQQQAANAQQTFGMGATTAQQQAALAQQGYGMASGTAMNQANIGNMQFGQGATTAQQQAALAQQQFGMGSTMSQQRAALAQQQYGMGANTAQQRAALAQQQYGMGANTSQQLAGLGAGAQGAALQGAQAQLAAGQMQQQTQQAGLQALYNQFLQQQSYPFQTAQFLANVAMGTGALSGNTTTTTQPGGFFSDERLKENVKEVGKTFDGQPIYSYNYKGGDKRQQIGLMAQEVEDKHPDAVGLAGGYKTVDYGKATENAAERGHFYSGGAASMGGGVNPGNYGEGFADGGVPMGGYDPALMQQILQNYNSMYGTLAQPGQPGMLGASTPGLGGIVPSANLPIPEMMRPADMPAAPDSGLDRASQIADIATKGQQTYKDSAAARAKIKQRYETYKTNKSYKEAAAGISDYMDQNGDPMGNLRYRAAGGEVGFDPDLAQQMMQRSQGMYGGLSGPSGASAGGPGATGGIVPASSAPPTPTSLQAGSPPPKQESGLDKIGKVVGIAANAVTAGKGAQDFAAAQKTKSAASGVRDYMDKHGDPLKGTGLNFGYGNAAGGSVGYATGGTPYDAGSSGQNALNIPDEKKEFEVLKPGDMPMKPDSGLDTVGKIAGTAASIAMLMAMKNGGAVKDRKGYALEGEVEGLSEEQKARIARLENPIGTALRRADPAGLMASKNILTFPYLGDRYETNKRAYDMQDKIQAAMAPGARNPTYGLQDKIQAAMSGSPVTQSSGLMPPAPAPRQRPVAAAPRPSGVAAGAPPAAAAPATVAPGLTGSAPPALMDNIASSNAVQAAPKTMAFNPKTGERDIVPQGLGGVLPTAAYVPGADEAVFAGKHPFLSGAKDYLSKSENVVPLLAGIAAMGTAPTRSLGVALASGVGAGAKSYMDVRKQQADIGETKARTSQSRAAAFEANRATRESIAAMLQSGLIVVSPNDPPGTYVNPETGEKYVLSDTTGSVLAAFPSTGPVGPAASGAPVSLYALPEPYVQKARTSFVRANNLDETNRQQNTVLNTSVRNQGREEIDTRPQLINLMDAIGRGENQGRVSAALATGPFASTLTRLFSAVNSAAAILGVRGDDGNPIQLGQEDITRNTIMDKIGRLQAAASASGANQDSFGALEKFINSQPNASLPKETNIHLIGQQAIDSQRAVDRMGVHEAFSKAGGLASINPTNYLGNEAEEAYRQTFTNDRYIADQKAFERVVGSTRFPEMIDDLKSGDPERLNKVKTKLEEFRPGLSRYFIASVR